MADVIVKLQIPSSSSQASSMSSTKVSHGSSSKRAVEAVQSVSPLFRTSVMNASRTDKSSMFVMTPDGVIHQKTSEGEYSPEITVDSYSGSSTKSSKLKLLA